MNIRRSVLCLALGALVALPAFGQGKPTGRVSGKVTSAEGEALPGVTVTFSSPALQGTRVVSSGEGGTYTSPPLDPGRYEVKFELQSFQTLTHEVVVGAGLQLSVDATLPLGTVEEEIVVTSTAGEAISSDSTSAQMIPQADLEQLPIDRSLQSAVSLAPGVHNTGPNGGITISGAQSWENLFTLNGVVLNENIRGQPFDLFIEDAIQETTTASAGISAEFGRFTGGVVTAITKSGGNQFAGSFRTSFVNDDWQSSNEFSPEREDKINKIYEATLGGFALRDKIWFFGAGRDLEETASATTTVTNISYPTGNDERRLEGKLTAAFTNSHQVQASYIEIEETQFNVAHGGLAAFAITTDDGSIDPQRDLPQELRALNYTGILTNNFFVEAQYSEREFSFVGTGGTDRNIATGTPIFDLARGVVYNESLFCDSAEIAECPDEERDNEQGRLKASWFLSTANAGSHDLAVGVETFTDIRKADNHQSPNDLMVWNFVPSRISGNRPFPIFLPGGATFIMHLPILNPSRGTDFETRSLFVNDRWRLNDKWSFNVGARYDETDAVNSLGNKVAEDDAISPRLGATFAANENWTFNASFATYVGGVANGVFDSSSSAGNPAAFGWFYNGPPIGLTSNVDPAVATQQLFDWLAGVCPNAIADPFSCPFLAIVDIPGATTLLDENLSTPTADEYTIGFQRRLGRRGVLRVDYVHRDFQDLFITRRDRTTGVATDDQGNQFDLGFVINDDTLARREYDGLNVFGELGLFDNDLRIGGNVTISKASGTIDGETGGSGPISSALGEYPEYKEPRWNTPEGDLSIDQRVRARIWGIYRIFDTTHHSLSASILQHFNSGSPYGAASSIDSRPYVVNPGYITPPTTVTYFFTGRDAFTTDDLTRTDLSLNYSFKFREVEVFLQPEVLNVFNEDGVDSVDTTVDTASTDPSLLPFNPFTETPVEGVHWRKGDDFGQPLEEDDLQLTRVYRFSVGIRF